ncbi:unnamed protein product [Pedinophyceae sp. YPF-701]|nr:unnamed protein product [Pedinophyceae sp. YPF-701]
MKSFKYLYVPWNPNDPIEERSLEYDEKSELACLINALQAHFRGTSKSADQLSQQKSQLRASVKGQGAVDEGLLDMATDMQLVEAVPLLTNNAESRYTCVNMYVDDSGQIKNLPPNPRASQIAQTCGNLSEVRGDAFIARVVDDEAGDVFRREDFCMSDLSSDSPWMKLARQQWARKAQERPLEERFPEMAAQATQGAPKATVAEARALKPPEPQAAPPGAAEKDMGNKAFAAGRNEDAVEFYTKALEINPGLVAARNNRAMALLRLGKLDAAIADCTAVLEAEPNNVKALLRRGAAREQSAAPGEAGAAARAAAADDFFAVLKVEGKNKQALEAVGRLAPGPPAAPAVGS